MKKKGGKIMNNSTEKAKDEFKKSKNKNEILKNPVIHTLLTKADEFFPVYSILTKEYTENQDIKRMEFYECIANDNQITVDNVKDDLVILEFIKTYEAVEKLAINEKVKYYSNMFTHYARAVEKDVDEYQELLLAFNDLSYREIKFLDELYRHEQKYIEEKDWQKSIDRLKCWNEFVTRKCNGNDTEAKSRVLSIMRTGFCICEWYLSYGSPLGMIAFTTPKYERLSKYINK